MQRLKRFLKGEEGLELSEYAVLIALIIMIAVAVIGAVGLAITGQFQKLLDQIGGP